MTEPVSTQLNTPDEPTASSEPKPQVLEAHKGNIITRAMFSVLVASIVAGLSGFTAYAIMGGIENTVIEIILLIVLYLVSPVVLSVLRSIRYWTLADLILLHIFGLTFAIIGFQYALSAVTQGV